MPRASPPLPPTLGQRLVPPDPSAAVPDWARAIGVTRVARVTGLDRCGVEVACAIRPAGHILQVSNGKGASFAHAKAAALSEALELWCCENVDPARVHWLPERPTADFWPSEFLGLSGQIPRDRTAVQPWAEAERLDVRGRVFVPASHVWCPPSGGLPVGLRTVPWTANGMSAHRTVALARWHGLLELLEREALCRILPDGWTPEHLHERALRWRSERVDSLEKRGLFVHAIDVTPARWPVPIVAVLIADPDTRAPALAAGYACRRTGEEAAEAAFFEACQSRLTEIHGAREDVVQTRHELPDWVREKPARRREAAKLPAWKGSMAELLRALGVAAASVSLAPAGASLAVERVFVPGFRLPEYLT